MTILKGILTDQLCTMREKALRLRKSRAPNKAIAAWIEDDRLINEAGKALVIIMNSSGCDWALGDGGGCSMCGYSNDTSEVITDENLIEQVQKVLQEFSDKTFQSVKLFNSGSFLDENEIPIKAQDEIMKMVSNLSKVTEVIVETRPEFVTKKALKRLKAILGNDKELELGIGLESSDDFIRINYINKGFLFNDFNKAVKLAINNNVRVKSYLLFKPPFLTEKEAIADTIQSTIDSIKVGARTISINPVNIQNGTLVFKLWRDDLYRPPRFWSLKEIIQIVWQRIDEEGLRNQVDRIVSDPSGAGSQRGIHNGRHCDKYFVKALKKYTLTQNPEELDQPNCWCETVWRELLEYEVVSRDSSLRLVENAHNLLK